MKQNLTFKKRQNLDLEIRQTLVNQNHKRKIISHFQMIPTHNSVETKENKKALKDVLQ